MTTTAPVETFTAEERCALEPYVTNVDQPVFALINLPETVKGALFARYSRSAKSLRRLFLDEFRAGVATLPTAASVGSHERADALYRRVLGEYGDDSVAQLGGVHVACEGVSNVLTKVLEWGRLMSYLEQSTRYVPYTDRPNGQWKYHVPDELPAGALRDQYVQTLDDAFATYASLLGPTQEYFRRVFPRASEDSEAAYASAIRAKALDTLRGLLPAATRSNVGIYGSGQGYESLLLRMRAHALAEVRDCGEAILRELRKVIPAFLSRVDQPERGLRWSRYLADTKDAMDRIAGGLTAAEPLDVPEVALTDFDPEGEIKIVAAALYAVTDLSDQTLLSMARQMSSAERADVLRAYVGNRGNRRHKPGRAFERTSYRFDIVTDYSAFRDLQRHRLLTIEWQTLSTKHGYGTPDEVRDLGIDAAWRSVMKSSAQLWEALVAAGYGAAAPYAVSMAYRVRFFMQMNAREAMHVIELRTTPQGHPTYRRVCQQVHRLIAEQAGHRAVAEAMKYADHTEIDLERLGAERVLEKKRAAQTELQRS